MRALIIIAMTLLAAPALAARARGTKEQEALKKELQETRAKLRSLEKRLDTLIAEDSAEGPASRPSQEAIDRMRADLDAMMEEGVSREDLKKYMRKPDETEMKSRFSAELEARFALLSIRRDEINRIKDRLTGIALDPETGDATRDLIDALRPIADRYAEADKRFRPRLAVRLYWEINRFLDKDGDTFFFANAQPELVFFILDNDIDRSLIARNYLPDFAHPRDRLSFIVKKASVGLHLKWLSLSAGVLQFTHGGGFFINPTNRFTPKNPLDPRREVDGVPAAQAEITLLSKDALTLSLQLSGIVREARQDLQNRYRSSLSGAGMASLKAVTPWFSITAIGMYEALNAQGMSTPSFGGILSANPFGLTLSVEALATESPEVKGKFLPEMVASAQLFIAKAGPGGMTLIAEYYRNFHNALTQAGVDQQLDAAIRANNGMLALDRLTKPLRRADYISIYIEPSLTEKLKLNIAGLMGVDGGFGALMRAGIDYEFSLLSLHAYGGYSYGVSGSEFRQHVLEAFAEVAITANF